MSDVPTIDRNLFWKLRTDLLQQQIRMGGESLWVLQDPLSRQMHYFSMREYALLRLLNGKRSIAEISSECVRRFAPDFLSVDSLVSFLASAQRRGLIVCDDITKPYQEDFGDETRGVWWKQPLAIRLPGFHPDPLIDPLARALSWVFHPRVVISIGIFVVMALMLVLSEFSLFSEHLSVAATRGGASWIVLAACVIAATKVIHEFSHAFVCSYFGAACREIGVMLLAGIPCLYCDVSEAWMLPKKRQRIMVSAAGMLAELLLASIATMLWWFSADGVMRDVCVTVMVVCSVSTIVFNGNPLLRYDGYFILSDLVGIPNLSAQSRAELRRRVQNVIWGVGANSGEDGGHARGSGGRVSAKSFLLGYAVCSGSYRVIVYSLIAYAFYRLATNVGLGAPVGLFLIILLGTVSIKSLANLTKRPTTGMFLSRYRPFSILAAVLVVVTFVVLVPLPRTISAPSMVHPRDSQTIYATVSGRVVDAVRYGDRVVKGQTLTRLDNFQVCQEALRLNAECDRLSRELRVLAGRRVAEPEVGAKIPTIKNSLSAAQHRRFLHQQRVSQLIIESPMDGVIYAAETPASEVFNDDRVLDPHDQLPVSPNKHHSWIESGTPVCVIGAARKRDAILWVRQQDIPLLQVGQQISWTSPNSSAGLLRGQVTHLATEPVEQVDHELLVTGRIGLKPGKEHLRQPSEVLYQVRARLETGTVVLPARLTGMVRVKVQPASLLSRFSRWLNDSFRFQS